MAEFVRNHQRDSSSEDPKEIYEDTLLAKRQHHGQKPLLALFKARIRSKKQYNEFNKRCQKCYG